MLNLAARTVPLSFKRLIVREATGKFRTAKLAVCKLQTYARTADVLLGG